MSPITKDSIRKILHICFHISHIIAFCCVILKSSRIISNKTSKCRQIHEFKIFWGKSTVFCQFSISKIISVYIPAFLQGQILKKSKQIFIVFQVRSKLWTSIWVFIENNKKSSCFDDFPTWRGKLGARIHSTPFQKVKSFVENQIFPHK